MLLLQWKAGSLLSCLAVWCGAAGNRLVLTVLLLLLLVAFFADFSDFCFCWVAGWVACFEVDEVDCYRVAYCFDCCRVGDEGLDLAISKFVILVVNCFTIVFILSSLLRISLLIVSSKLFSVAFSVALFISFEFSELVISFCEFAMIFERFSERIDVDCFYQMILNGCEYMKQ